MVDLSSRSTHPDLGQLPCGIQCFLYVLQGIFFVSVLIESFIKNKTACPPGGPDRQYKFLLGNGLICLIVSLFAGLINPYTYKTFVFAVSKFSGDVITAWLAEYRPPVFWGSILFSP